MIKTNFEDTQLGSRTTSAQRTITEDYVLGFAEMTWDRHPLHLDPQYAARSRFGGQVAHGALLVSTLLGLVELDPRYLQCFYGIDQLRFRAPTYFGDTVHAESEIVDVRPRSDGVSGVVACQGALINQDGQTLLSGVFSFLVAGRAATQTVETVPQ